MRIDGWGVSHGLALLNLASFRKIIFFAALSPLQHHERPLECALRRRLVALEQCQLAVERLEPRFRAIEMHRLRPRGAPQTPDRVRHNLGEQLFPAIPRRDLRPHRRVQPAELLGVLHDLRPPRGQPMAQRIAARLRLSPGGLGAGTFQGIQAVCGDLGARGHGIHHTSLA